jgi:hypothetical protein
MTDVNDYELLPVTVNSDGTHTVAGSWTPGTETLGTARSELGVYSVDYLSAIDALTAAGDANATYLYAVGGHNGTMGSSAAEAALVLEGGQLDAFGAIAMLSPAGSGFVSAAGNGFLFVFGGTAGGDDLRTRARVATDGSVPAIVNWNNEGGGLTTPRVLADGIIESGHLFMIGGADTGGTVLSSTERQVW